MPNILPVKTPRWKGWGLILILLGLIASPVIAAQTVVFGNASFEAQVLGEGGFTPSITSWSSSAAGAFNPDQPLNFAPDGSNVVYFDNGGSINQNLVTTGSVALVAQPGATLTVNFSARGRTGQAGSFDLLLRTAAGTTVAGPITVLVPANASGYSNVTGNLTILGPNELGANLNQPLNLLIQNASAGQLNVDQFTASYSIPPTIQSFVASPNVITQAGGSSTLSWSVSNAVSLTLDGQAITDNSVVINPSATASYTLAAFNPDGTTTSTLIVPVVVATALRISEFMAANTNALADGNGQFSDWVEIENPTNNAISTTGYFLTDDPANPSKWPFPARSIAPGGRLLVFCSGQLSTSYADLAGNPHTNFRLADQGEYLALVGSNGIASEFAPTYPQQFVNISYGPGMVPNRIAETLVGSGSALKYIIPTAELPGWQGAGFADGGWTSATQSIGFDESYGPLETALSTPANTAGNQAYGLGLGMDFVVTQKMEVSELGVFDDGSNGVAAGVTLTVQLWSRNDNGTASNFTDDTGTAVLASTTFTTAAPGALAQGNRFKSIPPIILMPGAYTINAHGFTAAERNGNGLTVTQNGGGALTFVGRSRYGASAGAFPGSTDGGPETRYSAGTFRFRTSPASVATTNVAAQMFNVNSTAYVRIPFTVADPSFASLQLSLTYDDGFVAYLNGTEIARRNAPAVPTFDGAAIAAVTIPNFTETMDVSPQQSVMQAGQNVLAIHGLNLAASDTDFKLDARLRGERTAITNAYFTVPTPGNANGQGMLFPQVVINEIHSDPTDSNTFATEFIELYNPLSVPVDVSGWAFTKGVTYTFPNGTIIPARSYLVVAENPTTLLSRLGAISVGPWIGSLKNDGETIELVNALGAVVDSVTYGLSFPWPTVGSGPSTQLLNEGLDNDLGGAWRAATPTPGTLNSGATINVPPMVRQVKHTFIASPTPTSVVPSNAPVTITAKITDADGIFAANVEYQIVEPGNFIRLHDAAFTTNWTSIPMAQVALDGTYSATVPASVQQHRRLIRYRIQATDEFGQSISVPLMTEPCPNFAYFCYDGVPAWTGAVQPGVTANQTFSEATMRKVRPWHLLSQSGDVQACQYNPSFNDGVYRFYGAIVVEGVVYDHVRYRIKGQGSTFNTGKNKWKFKFNPGLLMEMPDDYGDATTPVETLNISSVPSPWAPWNRGLAGLDEVMQFRLSNLAGVPAPNSSYLQWRVIDGADEAPSSQFDGDLFGLYLAFENQDNHFKAAHDLPDGNIFRMQAANNHVLGQGGGQPDNLSDLNAFVSATTGYNKGTAGNVATYQDEAWFRANVDMARYYSWRAVAEAVNGTDIRDQENVVYFRDPVDGRWHIQPWDCDLLYEQFDRWGPKGTQAAAGQPSAPYEQIRRGLAHPALRIEFQNRARELQDLLLNQDQAWKLIDEYVSIITDQSPGIIANGAAIAPGFVEADRMRWDYWPLNPVQPRSNGNNFGQFYLTSYAIGDMGNGPFSPQNSRTLASADFAGMVKWVKDFIASDASGGARLTEFSLNQRDQYTLNPTGTTELIPATPVLSDLSSNGHPINDLRFQTTPFSSPNGQTFTALQWRIAEVRWPGLAGHVDSKPWRYEIEDTWTSAELAVFNNQISIPAQALEVGVTYRVRVKMKDAAGHWSHWSQPVEFVSGPADVSIYQQNLVVSEVMYKPNGGSDYEFIELRNLSTTASLDLSPVTISDGLDYAFPSGVTLPPGGNVVVPKNLALFQSRYGMGVPTASEWGINDSLNNSGDTITLKFGQDIVIRSFTYQPSPPWPDLAGLVGHSIVLKLPSATAPDHSVGQNWRASLAADGNPGDTDATRFVGDPVNDVDQDGLDALLEYALGTTDGNGSQGPNAFSMVADPGVPGSYIFKHQRAIVADDIHYALEKSTTLVGQWSPADATLLGTSIIAPGVAEDRYQLTPAPGESRIFIRLRVTN